MLLSQFPSLILKVRGLTGGSGGGEGVTAVWAADTQSHAGSPGSQTVPRRRSLEDGPLSRFSVSKVGEKSKRSQSISDVCAGGCSVLLQPWMARGVGKRPVDTCWPGPRASARSCSHTCPAWLTTHSCRPSLLGTLPSVPPLEILFSLFCIRRVASVVGGSDGVRVWSGAGSGQCCHHHECSRRMPPTGILSVCM